MPTEPEFPPLLADLLPAWQLGLDADTDIRRPEHGTNNQTFLVARASQRFVLRISENLSPAQVQAEQRLLGWLRRAGLPFAVPEPVAATDGKTMIETPAGPATLSRWLPGERPDFGTEPALERFGRAVGMLGQALQRVPSADAPQDWLSSPLPVPRLETTMRWLAAHGDELVALVSAQGAALPQGTGRRHCRRDTPLSLSKFQGSVPLPAHASDVINSD